MKKIFFTLSLFTLLSLPVLADIPPQRPPEPPKTGAISESTVSPIAGNFQTLAGGILLSLAAGAAGIWLLRAKKTGNSMKTAAAK